MILALFATGYVAMTRHITNAGAFYAFISRGLGRPAGVAAALVALLAYTFLQVGLYGAFGPNAAAEAAAHLGLHAPWWVWALAAWAVVTVLGLLRVDITGRVLGVLLTAEIVVILAETVAGWPTRRAGTSASPPCRPRRWARPGSARSGCWPWSPCSGSSGSSRPRCWPRRPATRGGPSRWPPTWRWA